MATNEKCATIEALEGEWSRALCGKDLDKMRALMHPDFTLIGMRSTGPFRMHRDEWLEAIQHRDVVSIDLKVQDATAAGDTLIGTVFAKWRLRYLGREIEDSVVLTDVWVRGDKGQWQALRRHSTPAPTGRCAEGLD